MHLDRKSLVKKRFISDGLETFFCRTKAGNIEPARQAHVARLGSQS